MFQITLTGKRYISSFMSYVCVGVRHCRVKLRNVKSFNKQNNFFLSFRRVTDPDPYLIELLRSEKGVHLTLILEKKNFKMFVWDIYHCFTHGSLNK